MRTLYWTGSFHYIKYKGVRATPKQAPIICAAPHTSFFDSILVIVLGPSSVVAKSETSSMTFFGSKIIFLVYVYFFSFLIFCLFILILMKMMTMTHLHLRDKNKLF